MEHAHGDFSVQLLSRRRNMSASVQAVFFDLGDTLGSAVLGGHPPLLVDFDVFPFVPGVLADLKSRGLRLGVISNTGDEKGPAINAVLAPKNILPFFDAALLVYSGDEPPIIDSTSHVPVPVNKSTPEIFRRAARRAGLGGTPERCLFVGEDAHEREVASSAGWQACPHPLLVAELLDGQPLQYAVVQVPQNRIDQPWREILRREAFVPLQFTGEHGTTVYGLTSERIARQLGSIGFDVELLGGPNLPQIADLYELRDDLTAETAAKNAARNAAFAVESEAMRAFTAANAGEQILKYLPQRGVIAALTGICGPDQVHFRGARHGHTVKLSPDPLLWEEVPSAALTTTGGPAQFSAAAIPSVATQLLPAEILATVRRYSGQQPLDAAHSNTIESRHIAHAGNRLAVNQLMADLQALGQGRLQVRLHQFSHSGLTLFNVEAELAGESPELVLVTAHLDSTASADAGYQPELDPAAGADDDASGVAAVLAIARQFLSATSQRLPRTVRFVLFNAEEQGLIGSMAYARRSKSRGEAIVAVWQMDMIGYNAVEPSTWEVHAGFAVSAAVEASSRRLAELLRDAAHIASPELPTVQIYDSGTSPAGDGASGRSDHASFQKHGYSACVISEDFFVDPEPGAAPPDENPNYHSHKDQAVDPVYAAKIARAVFGAAWLSATEAIGSSEFVEPHSPTSELNELKASNATRFFRHHPDLKARLRADADFIAWRDQSPTRPAVHARPAAAGRRVTKSGTAPAVNEDELMFEFARRHGLVGRGQSPGKNKPQTTNDFAQGATAGATKSHEFRSSLFMKENAMAKRDSNDAIMAQLRNLQDEVAGLAARVRADQESLPTGRPTADRSLRKASPIRIRLKKHDGDGAVEDYHKLGPGIICDTEARGKKTPGGRSIAEIVVDASAGYIPLWHENVTLNWRFQERSLGVLDDPDGVRSAIEDLITEALLAWGEAAPIRFTKEDDAWDFEVVVKPEDNCNVAGCVLASSFFPDAGRHTLTVYPKMFEQSRHEQIDTLTHELGHTFGLRHFFADVSETAFPSIKFGTQNPFSIMNYGANSELTDADKSDLKLLYQKVWSGELIKINGTPIRLMRPFHAVGSSPGQARLEYCS
jgi:leucyl aminopeptidase